MQVLPLRLPPEADLRRALEDAVAAQNCPAAFVVCGIGSLRGAQLRLAGATAPRVLEGDYEIITLAGTISPDGAHLHISLADREGQVIGGHLAYGCPIRTTAEVMLMLLPDWMFAREFDPATEYRELVVRRA